MIKVMLGTLLGLLAGSIIASYVYVPQLKCPTHQIPMLAKAEKKNYPIGSFEHEVKRTQ